MQTLQPAAVTGRFHVPDGCSLAGLLSLGAALLILSGARGSQRYWCRREGEVYHLRALGGRRTYRLCLDGPAAGCDCPDGQYRWQRPGGCKHQQALRQALTMKE